MSDETYYDYVITLFSPNSLSHQEINFSHESEAKETLERLRYFFSKECIKVIVKLYRHEMNVELINPIDSVELYGEVDDE